MEFFETPVLFLIFNRPDLTEIVFKRIREVRPKYLFIAGDGPRKEHPKDCRTCEETRQLVLNLIDWECEVKTLFRDTNLGCAKAVSEAITWFFEHVEEGVILEDDCFPSYSFFPFCKNLLGLYKNDDRIMHISGGSYLPKKYFGKKSYYVSKYPFCWGWATWKKAWKKFNFDVSRVRFHKDVFFSKRELDYWRNINVNLENSQINSWAYRWNFSLWREGGMSIVSASNLIKNIGFSEESTHLRTINPFYKQVGFEDSKDLLPLIHPKAIIPNRKADKLVFERYNLKMRNNNIFNRIINKVNGRF